MHLPPAASYSVKPSRWHLALLCALVLAGWLAVAAYGATQAGMLRLSLLAAAALAGTCACCIAWHSSPQGLLQWDGSQWLWSGFAGAGVRSLDLVLDLQWLLLVQLRSEHGKTVYLFLDQRPGHADWLALRRAVLARPPAPGNVDDEDTVAQKSGR